MEVLPLIGAFQFKVGEKCLEKLRNPGWAQSLFGKIDGSFLLSGYSFEDRLCLGCGFADYYGNAFLDDAGFRGGYLCQCVT